MAKVFNFVIILSGLLLFLALAGFPTASNLLLRTLGLIQTTANGTVTDLNIGLILGGLFLAGAVSIFATSALTSGSVQVGTLVINTTDSRLVAPLCGLLIGWVEMDLYSVYRVAQSFGIGWITFFAGAIIFPIMIGFGIALIGWWRGGDI